MPMTTFERDAIMAALIDTGAPWDPTAVFIGVFVTADDHGINTVLSDLTLPTGDMADALAVTTWTGAHIKSDGAAMVDSPIRTFRPADYTEAAVIGGWYVADAASGGNLLAYGYITPTVALPDETYALNIVLHACVSPVTLRWFEATVMNG